MTGIEIARKAYQTQPHLQLAVTSDDSCIGSWDKNKGRYVVVAGRIISSNDWCSLPYELLVNGKPPVEEGRWIPVPNEVQS